MLNPLIMCQIPHQPATSAIPPIPSKKAKIKPSPSPEF